MLKIATRRTFKRKVKVLVPADNGHREDSVDVTYQVVPSDVSAKFNLMRPDDLLAFLREAVVQLGDLSDEQGNALPYSDDLRDEIFRSEPYVAQAVGKEYFAAIGGTKEGN